MSGKKKIPLKTRLHPRNKNRDRYDLEALIVAVPALSDHVKPNKYGVDSIDFSSPIAVKLLNKALLSHYYGFKHWDFPDENLCPPIPGRADYIHKLADLLSENNFGKIPDGEKVICLDIGVGASCIYPILGSIEYAWNFIASDIDPVSLKSAQAIIDANEVLKNKVDLRLQEDKSKIFGGVIQLDEKIDLAMCNPPFHASANEAEEAARRKVQNLNKKSIKKPTLNFAGNLNELVYQGGEKQFLLNMIKESKAYAKNCLWFSSLVSKESNVKAAKKTIEKLGDTRSKIIPMGTGNKTSRIIAWSFQSNTEMKEWRKRRWTRDE